MTTQEMDKAWLAFKVARDARDAALAAASPALRFYVAREARDAAQRAYDQAWALYAALDDANEDE